MNKKTTAKERVQKELEELNKKIAKLSLFLFSEKALNVSPEMRYTMKDQLSYMSGYAQSLQHRLEIWDTPAPIVTESHPVSIVDYATSCGI